MRLLSSSCLSVLLLATLIWGGCISCPQFFMFSKTEESCCDKAGKCKRSSDKAPEKECKRMPLEPPSIGGASHPDALAPLPRLDVEVLTIALLSADLPRRELLPLEHSPPDLHVLNATFRI